MPGTKSLRSRSRDEAEPDVADRVGVAHDRVRCLDQDVDEHQDVGQDQGVRDERRLAGVPVAGPRLGVGACQPGAVEAVAADRRLHQTLGAGRLAAPRAPPAGLAVGMAVTRERPRLGNPMMPSAGEAAADSSPQNDTA